MKCEIMPSVIPMLDTGVWTRLLSPDEGETSLKGQEWHEAAEEKLFLQATFEGRVLVHTHMRVHTHTRKTPTIAYRKSIRPKKDNTNGSTRPRAELGTTETKQQLK